MTNTKMVLKICNSVGGSRSWCFLSTVALIIIVCCWSVANFSCSYNLQSHSLTDFSSVTRKTATSSYVCDHKPNQSNLSSTTDPTVMHVVQVLLPYCSIVPTPRQNWKPAQRYSERDITFIIFTGVNFYYSRATAVHDTWISRVSSYYFLGSVPYDFLPVTVIDNAGEDNLSNMKKIFYGLQQIYKHQRSKSHSERQKWFYLAGCDTYVNTEHITKRLDAFDYTEPLLIGSSGTKEICHDTVMKRSHPISFPSGGAGFFISAKLLELMLPYLSEYVENIWPRTSPASDVALACLAFRLGVNLTSVPGFWAFPPARTALMVGTAAFHADSEPNTYHYLSPVEMHALDEFYTHQHVDRLVNDRNWLALTKFMRQFITSHYKLLSLKGNECKLPPIHI